jgi:hypothetical protein
MSDAAARAVHRYVGLAESKERLRPVLTTIISNFSVDEAVDMILRLVEAPQRASEPVLTAALPPAGRSAAASPGEKARSPAASAREPHSREINGAHGHKPTTPAGGRRARPPRAPPPLPSPGSGIRPLLPYEFYTFAEAEVYLGVKEQMIRNIMNDDAGALPFKRETVEGGRHPQTLLAGRGIIALRAERERAANGGALQSRRAHMGESEGADEDRVNGRASAPGEAGDGDNGDEVAANRFE